MFLAPERVFELPIASPAGVDGARSMALLSTPIRQQKFRFTCLRPYRVPDVPHSRVSPKAR